MRIGDEALIYRAWSSIGIIIQWSSYWGVETWKGRNCKMSRLWTRNWNDVLDMPTCLGNHLCWQILACKTEPELHEPEKSANQAHRTQKCRNLMFKIKLCAVRAQLLQRASASRGFQYRADMLRSHRPLRATVRSLWKIASAVLKCGSIWASLVFETSCKTWFSKCAEVCIFFQGGMLRIPNVQGGCWKNIALNLQFALLLAATK